MTLKNLSIFISIISILSVGACSPTDKKKQTMDYQKGQYGYDVEHLKEYVTTIELVANESRVVIVPEYQGRVMTSTTDGMEGFSFGWMNHEQIAKEEMSEQFNPFGGEERFWLGPEGGQFSIYFEKGKTMSFENWDVPPAIDTMPWDVSEVNPETATFIKQFKLENYSGNLFDIEITRRISIIDPTEVKNLLKVDVGRSVKSVAYESLNQLKNAGENDWTKETGLLSIWVLSMYNPSNGTTVVVPYRKNAEGMILKDDYFGKVPEDRLKVANGAAFFKADGKKRGKIGVPAHRALPVMGSYDEDNNRLTILECSIDSTKTDYVNSSWEEHQDEPFKGDVLNSYNDGPLDNGDQLGPFYELESSSAANELKSGEVCFHFQRTYHFEGSTKDLDVIAQKILGVSLEEIRNSFN